MADSIHVFGGSFGGGDAYVEKDGLAFDGFADIAYIGVQIYIPAATLAGWTAAVSFSPYVVLPRNTLGAGSGIDIYQTGPIWEDDNIGDLTGAPVGDTWVKLEWQLNPTNGTGPETIKLNGVVIGTATFGPFSSSHYVDKLQLGAIRAGGAPPDGDVYFGEIRVGTAADAFDKFHFIPATAPDLSAFSSVVRTVTLDTAPTPPPAWSPAPPPPGPSRRFFAGYPWRFIVTDLNSETITFLDRLATARQVTVARNTARDASGTVPSDSPEVNITHTDGDPFLAEGNRLVYGFRREGWDGLTGPWVCRFAGILDHLEDNAGTDAPATHWTARDPWQLLYKRPVRLADGSLPGVDGRVFLAADSWTYQGIAKRLLTDSILYDGTCFIDPDGGTVVDGTAIVEDLTLQQGLSVGAAWDQLCQTGNIDIELDPVYDPVGAPGICCTFTAKPIIGAVQNAAIFAWDLPSRSLASIGRVLDGTGRENTIQYYFGQGGPPVSLQTDATSVAKYGEYWAQQFWPGFKQAGPVTAMAARRLLLLKDGAKTFTFAPAPERSPIPFDDYMAGDWAPFYASKKLRAPLNPTLVGGIWQNIPRVEAFTIDIADNQTETVSQLLTSLEVQPT